MKLHFYILFVFILAYSHNISAQILKECISKISIENLENKKTKFALQSICSIGKHKSAIIQIINFNNKKEDTILSKYLLLKNNNIQNTIELQVFLSDWQKKSISEYIYNFNVLPFGSYKISLQLLGEKDTIFYDEIIHVDSMLSKQHKIHKEVNVIISKKNNALIAKNKINNLFKKYGLTYNWNEKENFNDVSLFLEGNFFGKLKLSIGKDKSFILVKNDLEQIITSFNFRKSLIDVFKETEAEKKNDTISGFINILGNSSNQQELNSNYKNAFYEIDGNIDLELLGIPVNLEGYYTSQDKNRLLKSSYFALHYDKEKMLAKVNKVFENYKNAGSKISGIDGVYKSYYQNILQELYHEKDLLIQGLKNKIADSIEKQYAKTINHYDSATQNISESIEDKQKKFQQYQDSVQNTILMVESKIEQIQTLINKAEKLKAFDTLKLNENIKNKNIDISDPTSAYEVVDVLYPNNHVTKILKKLNSFNIGMIQDNISKHTNNGQQMSGLNIGYDFDVFDVNFSLGKINNIDFNNNKKRYWVGSFKLVSKEILKQNIGFFYYTYQRNKDSNTVFDKQIENKPSNQILGVNYKLNLDYFLIDAGFSSLYYRNSQQRLLDHAAYFIQSSGKILQDKIILHAKYESIGKDFVNETNVFNIKNISTLTTNVQFSLWNNFIKGNISFASLQQQQANYTGQNKKWGFELRTESKRFPKILIAYKPFTTFKSITDSFSLQPVNLFGDIKMLRIDYQYRIKNHILKLVFNAQVQQNILDTIQYVNKNWNINIGYQTRQNTAYINIGKISLSSNIDFQNLLLNDNTYFMIGYQTNITSKIAVNSSVNFALQDNIVSKYGLGLFINKSFSWTKAILLIGGNWNYFKVLPQPQIYNAQLGFRLPFEFKR